MPLEHIGSWALLTMQLNLLFSVLSALLRCCYDPLVSCRE